MFVHRAVRRLAIVAAALTLLAPLQPADATIWGPVNAQTEYNWGKPIWQDDFVGPVKSVWGRSNTTLIRNQNGMLTLNTGRKGSVTATLHRPGATTGRWEIRLRSKRYSTSATNYTVRTELIPAGDREQHCGARNIVFEGYKLGSHTANLKIRNLPDLEYTATTTRPNLGTDVWNVFAVEVTSSRITWYVNAKAIRTEKRPAALSGVPFTVRFRMAAVPGKTMNQSRMQMDWLRQYSLNGGRAPEAVPGTNLGTYANAC
ncbi:family 16 glycosylhydrolase [Nocardioides jiangxiensis]|uniref:Family 16 glycosylhydrolase n=1 Tax=Nocardioides jiangxiensis TaxID=3064524 RepID=A0ABT9B1F4_9ACTN|nr:family 16 glycosylhydrolase [Nocardioides sp. WY-20]MDO7868674.1 family 16 glycosylhydrolase [Nocardioides sp. WY-20]